MSEPTPNSQDMVRRMHETNKVLRANEEMIEATQDHISRMLFHRYNSLKKAGFTEDQAFRYIERHGLG